MCVSSKVLVSCLARLAKVAGFVAAFLDEAEDDLIVCAVLANPLALYNLGLYLGFHFVVPRKYHGSKGIASDPVTRRREILLAYAVAVDKDEFW